MAVYGAKHLQWAPFAAQTPDASASAYPRYGTPVNLGPLVKVTDNPSYNKSKNYGDNTSQDVVEEFKEAQIDAEVTELSNANAADIFGATLATEGDVEDLQFGDGDEAPYGGMAFYTTKQIKGTGRRFQGIYYPMIKALVQGEEIQTKGESITLTNSKVQFTAFCSRRGKWKVRSPLFSNESEASDWVDAKIAAYVPPSP